jgi:hypothetical protein
MIAIFSGIGWLFNLIFVFGWYIAGCVVSLYVGYKHGKKIYTLVALIIAAAISWPLSQYSLNQVIESLKEPSVYTFTAYAKITWRIELVYIAVPSVASLLLSFLIAKKHDAAAKVLLCIALIGFISGITQVSIGLFMNEWFFNQHNIELHY